MVLEFYGVLLNAFLVTVHRFSASRALRYKLEHDHM